MNKGDCGAEACPDDNEGETDLLLIRFGTSEVIFFLMPAFRRGGEGVSDGDGITCPDDGVSLDCTGDAIGEFLYCSIGSPFESNCDLFFGTL